MPLQDINQGTPRDTLYSRGKGAHKQKTVNCRLRRLSSHKRCYRGPRGILCTRGEKKYASKRQPTVACDNRLVKREAYDVWPGLCTFVQKFPTVTERQNFVLGSVRLIGGIKNKTTKTVVLFFMVRRKQPQLNTSIKTVFC